MLRVQTPKDRMFVLVTPDILEMEAIVQVLDQISSVILLPVFHTIFMM